jgi:hypothetical protein
MVDDASHYRWLAASYARGALGRLDARRRHRARRGGDGRAALHRFKRTSGLPRVRAVLGALARAGRDVLVRSGQRARRVPVADARRAARAERDRGRSLPHRVADLAAVARGGVARLTAVRGDVARLGVATRRDRRGHAPRGARAPADPAPAAREALRLARRAVVVTVPSTPDDNPEHLRLFDRASLTALFVDAGARRVVVDGVRGHLVAVAACAATSSRDPTDARADAQVPAHAAPRRARGCSPAITIWPRCRWRAGRQLRGGRGEARRRQRRGRRSAPTAACACRAAATC